MNTVFYSGGPLSTGSMRRIQLRRNDKVIVEFDLYDLLLNGDKSKDVTLLPGDVILIPPVGPASCDRWECERARYLRTEGKTTLEHAVNLAGGFTAVTNNNKATVERVEQRDHQTFRVEDFPLNDSGLRNCRMATLSALPPCCHVSKTRSPCAVMSRGPGQISLA